MNRTRSVVENQRKETTKRVFVFIPPLSFVIFFVLNWYHPIFIDRAEPLDELNPDIACMTTRTFISRVSWARQPCVTRRQDCRRTDRFSLSRSSSSTPAGTQRDPSLHTTGAQWAAHNGRTFGRSSAVCRFSGWHHPQWRTNVTKPGDREWRFGHPAVASTAFITFHPPASYRFGHHDDVYPVSYRLGHVYDVCPVSYRFGHVYDVCPVSYRFGHVDDVCPVRNRFRRVHDVCPVSCRFGQTDHSNLPRQLPIRANWPQ